MRVVGDVPSGLPTPGFPDIGWQDVETLAGPAMGIALNAFVEAIALGRMFSRMHGYDGRWPPPGGAAAVGQRVVQG